MAGRSTLLTDAGEFNGAWHLTAAIRPIPGVRVLANQDRRVEFEESDPC